MNIVIIGGGASGLLSALATKKNHPTYNVLVIDKNDKLGKKLRATGNGKANICNLGDIKGKYSHELEAKRLFEEISPNDLIAFLQNIGIEVTNHYGDYIYPYSESANAFTDALINKGKELGVKYINNTRALDYKNNILKTDKGNYSFDKLVIATGLKSMKKLGADASFVLNLEKHGYNVIPLKHSLCPIKTKEDTKLVNGVRRKVNVKYIYKNKTYMNEDGELIFKKDGLSGIVIYHVASVAIRNNIYDGDIVIDFLPHQKQTSSLDAYFIKELAIYLKNKNPKKVIYHIKDFYGPEDSVATIGGVSLNDVDSSFKSKKENNVYIIGEALDQDGLCGGFNLMWAFISALKMSENI